MNARVINGVAWVVATLALAVNATQQGWDGFSTAGSIFGYTLICVALAVVIDNKIKED